MCIRDRYTNAGAIVASGTNILTLNTGALAAAEYYVQIQSNIAVGCNSIGMIINYDGLANTNAIN